MLSYFFIFNFCFPILFFTLIYFKTVFFSFSPLSFSNTDRDFSTAVRSRRPTVVNFTSQRRFYSTKSSSSPTPPKPDDSWTGLFNYYVYPYFTYDYYYAGYFVVAVVVGTSVVYVYYAYSASNGVSSGSMGPDPTPMGSTPTLDIVDTNISTVDGVAAIATVGDAASKSVASSYLDMGTVSPAVDFTSLPDVEQYRAYLLLFLDGFVKKNFDYSAKFILEEMGVYTKSFEFLLYLLKEGNLKLFINAADRASLIHELTKLKEIIVARRADISDDDATKFLSLCDQFIDAVNTIVTSL